MLCIETKRLCFSSTYLAWSETAAAPLDQSLVHAVFGHPGQQMHSQYLDNVEYSRIYHDQEQNSNWNDWAKNCRLHIQNKSYGTHGSLRQHAQGFLLDEHICCTDWSWLVYQTLVKPVILKYTHLSNDLSLGLTKTRPNWF